MTNQASKNDQQMGGFAAGTMVHTKDGLRPIEEIKVGDYVLSKPESGEGEISYQRVTRTFVHENKEVWALSYSGGRENPVGGWLVATQDYPIWQVYAYSNAVPSHIKPSKPSQRWMSVYEHFGETAEGYGGGGLLLANGSIVEVYRVYPVVQNEDGLTDVGLTFDSDTYNTSGYCDALDFSKEEPKELWNDDGIGFKKFYLSKMCSDAEIRAADDGSVLAHSWFPPLLRTVYNLEVENTHTYFVGEHGIWVHNTCTTDTVNIEISIQNQTLTLFDSAGRDKANYSISTAANGAGCDKNSGCTPLGEHIIRAKIGASAPLNTVFVGRRPTGEICTPELMAQFSNRDWILTRILWLSGTELGKNRLGNVDSMQRYIYIHGTPDSEQMGEPRSHGCIRMRNADVMALFEQVKVGTRVLIAA